MPGAPRRAAVVGHPVAHSLSPVMHRAAYAALGLDGWRYDAVDVEEDALPAFLAGLDPGWAGLSVTMPLKRAVRTHLVAESELAAQVGAVNTVILDQDLRLHGYNTDVYGILHALGEAGAGTVREAIVLGGGATAGSALAALRDLGCATPAVLVRSPERAAHLLAAAARLGVQPRLDPLDDATIAARVAALPSGSAIVCTLPAGAADPFVDVLVQAALAGPGRHRDPPVLLDVVYDPWPTALGRAWVDAGGSAAGGFAMLVHQAEGQVRLMTGLRPPLEVMRAAGQDELDRRCVR
jgi:shikimate dehydrogenase